MAFGIFSTGKKINSNDFPIVPPPGQPNLRQIIINAIATWNTLSPVRLVPRSGEPDFVEFVTAVTTCQSPFGRQGGRQTIWCNLARGFTGVSLMHESGHRPSLQQDETQHT